MQFAKSPPGVIRSVTQRWLFNSWKRLRNQQPLPLWRDLPVDDLKPMIDRLMFCDVVAGQGKARLLIRFCGKRIAQSYGDGDCRDKFLDQALPAAWRDTALATYAKVVEARTPLYNVVDTGDTAGRLVHLERLLLPFSHNGGGAVDHVLASVESVSLEGTFEQAKLGSSPFVSNNCSSVSLIEDSERAPARASR
jgi:hypothetical protein